MDLNLVKLRKEARTFRLKDKQIYFRLLALIELAKRQKNGSLRDRDYELVGAHLGKSSRSVYRWAKAYREGGVEALRPKWSGGKKSRVIAGWTALYIREMRLNYLWGAEVVQAHLYHDHGISLSQWKIHEFLKARGFIGRKRRRVKKSKHTKVLKILQPGAHCQIDVKHLPRLLKNGKKCYVFNFVDHASKWQFKLAYEGCGVWETYRFMQALLEVVPFKILRVQTDHGTEFTYRHLHFYLPESPTVHPMEHFCKVYGIDKKLIPVGEKEVNGLVERSHRMDDEELYQTIRPGTCLEFNRLLREHTKWLNSSRRRKPLNWKTANEYLNEWEQTAEEESDVKKAA